MDLPAFFQAEYDDRFPQCKKEQPDCVRVRAWLISHGLENLANALIPQLIVYASGGNILAFCPAPLVEDLANAIERRYAEETLIANACAVGDRFRLLELRFGKLPQPSQQAPNQKSFWLQDYKAQARQNPILQAYFDQSARAEKNDFLLGEQFKSRKTFSELVTQLASQFNQRRGGYDGIQHTGDASSAPRTAHSYPPLYETHPYLTRDEGDRRSALGRVSALRNLKFSEPAGRKYVMGQKAKRQTAQDWWPDIIGNWHPGRVDSWVQRFVEGRKQLPYNDYFKDLSVTLDKVDEARSLREIGAACNRKGFVAYIYADGNNMGDYIKNNIKTPEAYKRFSQEISRATEQAVYRAIAKHLAPVYYRPDGKSDRKRDSWIHPFEILTIGGDDVFLVVPGDKALAVAKTLAEEFENYLLTSGTYGTPHNYQPKDIHRYRPEVAPKTQGTEQQSKLSMSAGVLIAAENTPIYYAQGLVTQLLKSAKGKAKVLTKAGYKGGTVDFLVLKAVTAISSNLSEFREKGLTKNHPDKARLKLYGAPYTLHELGGLLETAEALKKSQFPISQIYKMRSLVEQGKRTAMLNYRYFRVRLKKGELLKDTFEEAWCSAKTNGGNLAPWMSLGPPDSSDPDGKTTYETIWRELVDLMPFVDDDIPWPDEGGATADKQKSKLNKNKPTSKHQRGQKKNKKKSRRGK